MKIKLTQGASELLPREKSHCEAEAIHAGFHSFITLL